MDMPDQTALQRAATDLADEVRARAPGEAAATLAPFGGAQIAAALTRLPAAFVQDVLAALPEPARSTRRARWGA
jgi:hypothetical protein